MTWFCSWLSDVQADGLTRAGTLGRHYTGPGSGSRGEMEANEAEVRCQLRVTSHQRQLFKQKQHRKETWKGSCEVGRRLKRSLTQAQPAFREPQSEGRHGPVLREPEM